MKCPYRRTKSIATVTIVVIALAILTIATVHPLSVVEAFGGASNLAKLKQEALSLPVKIPQESVKSPESLALSPVSGRLLFDASGEIIRAIDNVGFSNDVTDLVNQGNSLGPVFSPDGSKVIFVTSRHGENAGSTDLYIMDPDGANQRRLTFNLSVDYAGVNGPGYSFSRNGQKIVFNGRVLAQGVQTENDRSARRNLKSSGILSRTYVIDSDGSNLIIFPDPNGEGTFTPHLSPDGNKITFQRNEGIWVANIDGTGLTQIASTGKYPFFSADGQKVFWQNGLSFYRSNLDGTGQETLLTSSGNYTVFGQGKISPAGSKILFVCENYSQQKICVGTLDGTNLITEIGAAADSVKRPVWSPDGSQVAFIRYKSGNYWISIASALGGTATDIFTYEHSYPYYIDWQPACVGGAENITGQISYWAAENNAEDSVGDNHGNFVLDEYELGRFGQAFKFNGSGGDNFVEVYDSDSLDVQTGDYTLSSWVKISEGNREHFIAGKGACGGTGSNFYIGVNESNQAFLDISHESGGSRLSSSGVLNIGTWHNLILRKLGTDYTLFKDGYPVVFHSETGQILPNTASFTLGKGDQCTPPELTMNGAVDDVRLFGRALSNNEVLFLYNYSPQNQCTTAESPLKIFIINNPIAQGRTGQAMIKIPSVAPSGGLTIGIQSTDTSLITVPATVTIPEFSNSVVFSYSTTISDPNAFLSADIIATESTSSARATVAISPPASPDIAATNLQAPPNVNVFENLNVTVTITNHGEASTSAFRTDQIWLSRDEYLFNHPDDFRLAWYYDYNSVLNPGESKTLTTQNFQIPRSAVPSDGIYYIVYWAGSGGVNERNGNRANNFVAVPVHVSRNLPDLVAENISAPVEIEPGVPFVINWDVRNRGSAGTRNGFEHHAFLSFDQTVGNADDIPITYRSSGPLTQGQANSYSQQFTVTTLPVRPSSDALIYIKVDPMNQVDEGSPGEPSETNNVTTFPVRFEYRVPDLQISSVNPPSEVDSDTSFAIQWNTMNSGNRATVPMNESVYFSTDNQVGGDVLLGTFPLDQSLQPNESVTRIQNVSIPTNAITVSGSYYVYVKTDEYHQVDEGINENNNIRIVPVYVRRTLRPDLVVSNVTSPTTAFFNQQIQIQWTVTNSGVGPTNSTGWRDKVFIGPNPNTNGATFLADAQNVSYLAAGESYIATANVRIPRGFTGSYHILVRTDANNSVNEENENNNLLSRPITVNVPPLPDLRVSAVQAPDIAFAGSQILVSWKVTNNGDGAVPPNESSWYDGVYISRDNIFDNGDRFLGYRSHNGALNVGASYTVTDFPVNLPPDSIGDYYVFVVTDIYGSVYEYTNENNNSDYDRNEPGSPMSVNAAPPDLIINSPVTAPDSAVTGNTITTSFSVRNQGAFDAVGTWYESVWLSEDNNFNPQADTLLGNFRRTNLAAGQSYVPSINVTIPSCIAGNYYLFASTDTYNTIFEFDPNFDAEANNISSARPITITNNAADLIVTNVNVPPVVVNGSMPISWTVKNQGAGPTPQSTWYDRVYLMNGSQLITLGLFQRQGGLAVGAEYTQNQVVQVPLYLQGEFTIVVQADGQNVVSECSFEANNENSGMTTLQSSLPDLRINSVTAPSTAVVGTSFDVQWNGQNYGAGKSAGVWADRVYLSTNSTFEFYDSLIGGAIFNQSLATNETYTGNAQVTLPNVVPGNYYLITVADATGQIAEGSNEENNTRAVPITLTSPQIDLQVTAVNISPTIYSGRPANISWTVTNSGTQPTATDRWTDFIVLSRDSIYDPSDIGLGYRYHNGSLAAGASYTNSDNFSIPPGLTGDYRILVFTDRGNEVVESNDGNNLGTATTVLALPPPVELNITNIAAPASITLGEEAHFEWTVQNSSPNEVVGAWQDAIYLSRDQIWDSGDIFIGSKEKVDSVAAFATYTGTTDLLIPSVDPGNYYIIIRTDSRNSVGESDESNNVSASSLPTPVSVQSLLLDIPQNTSLVTGQERFYQIPNVPADETMLITLTGQAGSQNQLFTRYQTMVSRANYQFLGFRPGEPDQENVIPNTSPGNYYSMIRGDYVPGSFAAQFREGNQAKSDAVKNTKENSLAQSVTVKAELIPLSVRRIAPSSGGNRGWLSMQIDGAKFDENATVKLVSSGNHEIRAVQSSASATRIAALFQLNGEQAGVYDVVVTNPNNQSATLPGGFEIVNDGGHRLRASIATHPSFRGGTTQRLKFSAHNDGLNDAMNVPVFVQLPAGYSYRIDPRNYLDYPIADLPPDAQPGQIPLHVDSNGIRTIMLFAPLVRSRSELKFSIDVEVPSNYGSMPVAIQILPPLGEIAPYLGPNKPQLPPGLAAFAMSMPPNTPVDPNCWRELFRQIFFAALNEILPTDCLQAGWTVLMSSADLVTGLMLKGAAISTWDAVSSLSSKFVATAGKLAECAGVAIPWLRMVSLAVTVVQILNQLDDCLGSRFKDQVIFRQPFSIDPNEKVSPEGYGPEHFIGLRQPIEYRINFENLATAGAPAQIVRIVDELPASLDPRSFRLKEIGFKQNRIVIPEGRAFYQAKMQLGEDLYNLKAQITAGINISNGTAFWVISAIDPQTNDRPIDPRVGILPPNNSNGDGEGYVVFTVMPRSDQTTRTQIANKATIYFDENEPIETNSTSNLLDADTPTSSVAAMPLTSANPTFTISWTADDAPNGSGLKNVDLYVSEDGGDFRSVPTENGSNSLTFFGNWGRHYRFYTIATDNAGNVEMAPATPDAEITVLGGAYEGDVAPRPNGNNDGSVSIADLTQIRRFVAGLDTNFQYNEFQRADASPLNNFGDGVLSAADLLQARRYAAGLDQVRFAGGPNTAAPNAEVKTIDGKRISLAGREIHPIRVSRVGNQVTLGVILDAQGDEVGVGFSLNFDPAVISNPTNFTLGSGASGMTLTYNALETSQGRIGIVLDKDPLQPLPAGPVELVRITFTVAACNPPTAQIRFGNMPVRREVVNGLAQPLAVTFTDSVVSLVGPTAAPASVAGRVITTSGSGLSNIQITVTDADTGQTRTVKTNSFGNYRFEGLAAGRTYIVTAANRKYVFEPESRIVMLTQDIADVDFRVSN